MGKEDKEKHPGYNCNGLRIISMPDGPRIAHEASEIERLLPQVMAWKNGDERPPRCQVCDYCRATKAAEIEEAESGLFV